MMLAAFAASMGAAATASAANDGPVRLVVPAPAGGALDATARLIASRASALTGETFVVENRPGANSIIAAEIVARAAPDGRTLLFAGGGIAFTDLLQRTSFVPMQELDPVIQLTAEQFVLVASAESSRFNATDLTAALAAGPGLSCAAPPGPASIACEQLAARVGANLVAVPYPGVAPALAALLGGHADVMFMNLEGVARLIEARRVRVLARSEGVKLASPQVAQAPVASQLWPEIVLESHFGVLAPGRTAPERIRELNRIFNQVLADPQFAAFLARDGGVAIGGAPERYKQSLQRTRDHYARVIRQLGLGAK